MASSSAQAAGEAKSADVVSASRSVTLSLEAREQGEGAGARVRRSIGRPELRTFDPFLMLDEFRVKLPAGFPDHPHRGFETISYMHPDSKGAFTHEDSNGHKGRLAGGDLQWMSAARGIMHSEVPESRTDEARGLQLWLNLPRAHKLDEPNYQEFAADNIPTAESNGVYVRVIAGESLGVASPVKTRTPASFYHFIMQPNTTLQQPIDPSFNTFAYVFSGSATFGVGSSHPELANSHYTVAFKQDGDGVTIQTGEEACDFVLISGKPIGEPVAWHGPFVMTTRDELMQAFMDFQSGQNGFEGANTWRSENGRKVR